MNLSDSFYQTILDSLSDGVCAFDLDRRITYWNKGAEKLTGLSASEVLGQCCSDHVLVHVDENGAPLCDRQSCLLRRVLEGREMTAEVFIRHRLGYRIAVRVWTSPLHDASGQLVGALQVFTDNSVKVAAIERIRELEKLSYIDPLTELANRRYAEIILRTRCEEMQRYGWPFGVILLDVDNLKHINDSLGHEAGDIVLRAIAITLLHGSRPFDVKARWGGDEFIAIIANVDAPGLWHTANRLRMLVEQTSVPVGKALVTTTVSTGAVLSRQEDTPLELIRRSDRLLYESKRAGRNRTSMDPEPSGLPIQQ